MQPADLTRLRDDLLHYRSEQEDPVRRVELVEACLARCLQTLALIPDSLRDADVLELGGSPFLLTLCLQHVGLRCTLANYFGTAERRGATRLVHQCTGAELVFEYDLFNIETDPFPYPDARFDAVLFCELIEHLGINPVAALAEMHRVLRPGGYLIVTTPNSHSMARFGAYLTGCSQIVDRYSPVFGYGARHNREYHPRELTELLESTGFAVEELGLRDLARVPWLERVHRAVWGPILACYSSVPRAEHIFVRARRREPFRWHFPTWLFDSAHLCILVRHAWVEMGLNDSIQCGEGWHPTESRGALGGAMRWVDGTGQLFLKTPEHPVAVALEVYTAPAAGTAPAALRVLVWDRWLGRVDSNAVYADRVLAVERGRWQRLEIPLVGARPQPGDEVEVRIAIEEAETGARGLAVRRVELCWDGPTTEAARTPSRNWEDG